MGWTAVGQRTDSLSSDDIRDEQPGSSVRPNNQALYDDLGLGGYAYGANLNYASNQGTLQEPTVGTSKQAAHGAKAGYEDVNVHVPY